ncbi:THAP domain-containing protein 1-like [Myxocyprinus asiaticus]|uniref:THAP domain-containing protein 1-like n=1 Tax=Myxocyprinus asiaticus TaxID=70543 RepID=UPI002222B271|nr:THAP domain-containing protein 1-like [Myxocyprinus asiaticus]
MMVQSCSAYGCKNRYHKDQNISFHKFPLARPDVCGKWVAAIKRRNFKPTKYSNICSQHFTKDCFKRECNNRVLKDNAVPSLFTFSQLQMEEESLEAFSSEMDVSPHLHLSDTEEKTPVSVPVSTSEELHLEHCRTFICCDHNYTVEDNSPPKRRMEQLEEELKRLRKKLKTVQQKCRRQERQLERFKATSDFQKDVSQHLPLSDIQEKPADHYQTDISSSSTLSPVSTAQEQNPDHQSAFVCCDHNYTVEDSIQQKRRMEQLQEQLKKLLKKLQTVQQKCHCQERQLELFKATSDFQKDVSFGESYVILPKEIYYVLKRIETIGAL